MTLFQRIKRYGNSCHTLQEYIIFPYTDFNLISLGGSGNPPAATFSRNVIVSVYSNVYYKC